MKIIIESFGTIISQFDPSEVDHINVVRYFDINFAISVSETVTYINHFNKPIPKTGRILCVYLHKKRTFHLYDPDLSTIVFK